MTPLFGIGNGVEDDYRLEHCFSDGLLKQHRIPLDARKLAHYTVDALNGSESGLAVLRFRGQNELNQREKSPIP